MASTNNTLANSIKKLSTGLRINSAADDAAGLAISEKMRSQTRGVDQAVRNAQDGISMIQTAEGALSEVHSMLQRMRELSIQAASDTLTQEDRAYIDIEIGQLKAEIDRISTTTQFNRKQLLDGSSDVLWSASSLSTKVIVHGPVEREGNYKIELAAEDAGSGEIYKTNIMTAMKTKISPVYTHDVQIIPVDVEVRQGELANVDNLGFPQMYFSITGNDVRGTVTIAGVKFDFGGGGIPVTGAEATRIILDEFENNKTHNLLLHSRNSNKLHSVADATAADEDLEPGAPIDVSWDISAGGDGVFYLYGGDGKLLERGDTSTATYTITADTSDVVSVSWDPNKQNNMVDGTYYVDLCPARYLPAAVGNVITAPGKTPFLFDAGTLEVVDPSPANMSIAFEVTDVHPHGGSDIVAFAYHYVQIDANGNQLPSGSGAFAVDLSDVDAGLLTGRDFGGVVFRRFDISRDISQYTVGDKFTVTTAAAPKGQIAIATDTTLDAQGFKNHFLNYTFEYTRFDGTPIDMPFYQIDADGNFVLSNISIGVVGGASISHNHYPGQEPLYSAKFTIADTGTKTTETFNDAFIVHHDNEDPADRIQYLNAATEDTPLRDIQQMYTAGGRYILEPPQKITISQGDAIKEIVVYGDDTVGDVVDKINATIEGRATLTTNDPGSELHQIVEQLGAMAVRDSIFEEMLGLPFASQASAIKLSLASMTRDTLRKLTGVDSTYRDAMSRMWDDPGLTDDEVANATNVSLPNVARLREIMSRTSYTDEDIEFLTGLDPAAIEMARGVWRAAAQKAPSFGNSTVPGTIVIRSSKPGSDGRIELGGSEELIRALGINTIRDGSEPIFRASVYDAHSGETIASSVKFSGNMLKAMIDDNVDVSFDASEIIGTEWNDKIDGYRWHGKGIYQSIVHIVNNTTVLQIGANEKEEMNVTFGEISCSALGISSLNVATREQAAIALGKIDAAIGIVSKSRSRLGAYQNRLEHTLSNLVIASANTSESESRIRDADIAKEMLEFTKMNILSQAGNSMLAQANQMPENVMSLLRG